MAYVAPNGTIQLFRSVELTPAYTDTIWFPNVSTQDSVFTAQVDYQFTNQMYTRVSGNKVRVHKVADEIRDCSYMRFQNIRNNVSKWFYAFIINIEYINEQVTEIEYEIDEIQSWYFESNSNNHFSKCFIERQHSVTDEVGENVVPEPLSVTENIVCHKDFYWSGGQTYYLVVLGVSSITTAVSTQWNRAEYGGLASTVHYVIFKSATALHTFVSNSAWDNGFVKGLFGSDDLWAILGVYAVPSVFFDGSETVTLSTATGYKLAMLASSGTKTCSRPMVESGSTHGNSAGGTYTPKNNKMFTYPFSYFKIASPLNEQDYKYENFFTQSLTPTYTFTMKSCCNPEPALLISPKNYNGEEYDLRFAMTIAGFPNLTVFQSTQSGEIVGKAIKNAFALSIAALGASVGSGAVLAADIARDVGIGTNTAPLLSGGSQTVRGSGNTDLAPQFAATSLPAADDIVFEVDGYRMGLRKEIAQLFDNYMSRYGYAQNKIDTPNVHARQKWTYIKTRDCRCTVNAPASSLRKINDIMNNGITWWDFQTSVGNYGNFTNPVHGVG